MTSNSQEQHMLRVSQQSGKSSVFAVALGIALFGVFLSAPAQAATFMVNSPVDGADIVPGDGVCHTGEAVPTCTLRAAIIEANALPGADQIILPPNAYVLTFNTTLAIRDHLTITGGGASATFIDGNATRQVFFVGAGIFVNFSGITIRNGFANGAGGGINNFGTLTLISSTVSGNHAFDWGGGISNNNGGTLTLTNSTVSGNSATVVGGGIFNFGTLALTNSTVSGNTALGDGGGIYNHNQNFMPGTAILFNVTITDNRADANLTGIGTGGGVFNVSGSTFNFQNTIIAGNRETRFDLALGWVSTFRDCAGTLTSIGNNLMRNDDNCTVNGSAPTVTIPMLGPLQNNGGPTQTHALLAGSPAIDGGNPAGCRDLFGALITTDQRGRLRHVDGNKDGTARCDIGAVEFGSRAGVTFNFDVDFDGDGRNDIGVYRDGMWFILRSSDGGVTATGWGGLPQDIPVPGDYDGDGKTDIAVYRDGAQSATEALWFIRRSVDGGTSVLQWGGLPEDIPVPGDYDGDGKTDLAVYRSGVWFIVRSFDGVAMSAGWGGLPQDVPVPADYDGDGRTDVAVYRDGTWHVLLSSGGVVATAWGGLSQDIPVPADYDGDGKTDIAVYRDGVWFILRSSDGGVTTTGWGGLSQDVMVPGDYDGDGKADIAVYRDGNWHIIRSVDGGVTSVVWGGLARDIPLSRRND